MNRSRIILAVLLLLSFSAFASAKTVRVTIQGRKFSPNAVQIHPGDEVVWVNGDDNDCTIDADDGSFSSPTLKSGDTYRQAFTTKGVVTYGSRLYPRMHGTINVN